MVPFGQIAQFLKRKLNKLNKMEKITKEDTKIKGKLESSYKIFK
jgi:hypothetical protein